VASVPRAHRSAAGIAPLHSGATPGIHHYLYVFTDQSMSVYDIDHGHGLVQTRSLPGARGIRGAAFAPATHTLYVSYGNDRAGPGSLLAYDPARDSVKWTRTYSFGIDSMAVSPDGKRIYMPTGELASGGTWQVLDAHSGDVIGSIEGGHGPHNTIASLDGSQVYLGGRNFNYLEVASTRTDRVVKRIGPLRSGVRPFTINGRQTLAFTTATGFLGFQVSSIASGRVLYTRTFKGFSWNPSSFPATAPSHGISLAPNEREVWVIDGPNSYVHAFDVSRLPGKAPRPVANIQLPDRLSGQDAGCLYDCTRDGWLLHSRDGRYVYVGDSGDVIDAIHHRPILELPALHNTRVFLEIDWQNGTPAATTTRSGLGYVTGARRR
jgi:DNA-binding beta-propeller fold protein YncE